MKSVLNECIGRLEPILSSFPWAERRAYACLLAQTYYYVTHSTRLLCLAASRLPVEHEPVFQRMCTHVHEEQNHHLLALHDLERLGHTLEEFPELAATAALYQSQYYRIEHEHPLALFGYVIALEGLAAQKGARFLDVISGHFGPEAATFVKAHSELDPWHVQMALDWAQTFPEHSQQIVKKNLVRSAKLYGLMIDEVRTEYDNEQAVPINMTLRDSPRFSAHRP